MAIRLSKDEQATWLADSVLESIKLREDTNDIAVDVARIEDLEVANKVIMQLAKATLPNKDFATPKELKDKYVFWDIDGTLAPYRFNNHVADPDGTSNGQSLQEIEDGVLLNREPSRFMQAVLSSCGAKEHIILGHTVVDKEVKDKIKWLDRHYHMVTKKIFIPCECSKADALIHYCERKGIKLEDTVFVDDVVRILAEAERKGIKSYHISSFMDWFIRVEQ